MNDQRPAYHPEAAEDAWQRIISHFRQNLRKDVFHQSKSPTG
jgi:dienelactone hydrolase